MDIGTLMATIGADLSPLKEGLAQAEKSMRDASSQMATSLDKVSAASKAIGQSMMSAGKSMTKYVTVPILGAATASFKFYKDFEANLGKVEGLVGIARNQVQEWSKDILRLAPELGKGPKELSDALFFVTSAGMRGAAAMDVLEMSAKGSAAGLGEVKVVADLVTSAVNAYGAANLSASQAVDILVGTVREGKAEAPALAGSLGALLPVASELGVSFDQIGAATAAMTRTGTDASMAATQLRQIMMSLLKPTKQAEEALNRMGTSSELLRKKMREDGLLAVLMDIRERTAEFGEEAIAEVFGNVRALTGVLDLMGSNLEENKLIFAALTNSAGDLDKALKATHNTVEHKWNQAIAASQTLVVTFGQSLRSAFLPVLENLISLLTRVSAKVASFSEGTQRAIGVFAGLAAAIGPALIALGYMMTNVIPGLIKFFNLLRIAIIATRFELNKLALMMAANPYIAAGMALLLLASSLALTKKRAHELDVVTREISKRTTSLVAEETAEVRKLVATIQSETVSRKQQADALEKLNAISPTYFANLQLQGVSAEKASLALRKYIGDLAGQDITVRQALNTMTDYTKSTREQERALTILKNINAEVFAGFKTGSVTMSQARTALTDYTQSTNKQRKEIEQLVSTVSDEKTSREDVITALARLSELAPTLASNLLKEKGLVQGLTTAYNAWADAITKKARAAAAQEYLTELYKEEFIVAEKLRQTEQAFEEGKQYHAQRARLELAVVKAKEEHLSIQNKIASAIETNIRAQRDLVEGTEDEIQKVEDLAREIEALVYMREQLTASGQSSAAAQTELQNIDNRINRLEDERKKLLEVINARKEYVTVSGGGGTSTNITKGIVVQTEEEIQSLTTQLRTSTDESEIRTLAQQINQKQRYLETLTGVTQATTEESRAVSGLSKETQNYLNLFKEAESVWDEAAHLRRLTLIEEEIKKRGELIQIVSQVAPIETRIPEGTPGSGPQIKPKTFSTDLDILQITQDFQTGMQQIDAQAEMLGASFDAAGARVNLAKQALDAFRIEGLNAMDAEVKQMMETLQTFTVDEIFTRYAASLEELKAKQETLGEGTTITAEHFNLVQQSLIALNLAGVDPANEKLMELIETLRLLGIEMETASDSMIDWKQISQMAASSVASGFMNAAMAGEQSTGEIIKQIMAQVVAQLIQQAIETIPPPLNIIAAAGMGAVAGKLFSQIPAFATGALAYGPTVGLIGEYAGASTNPEVIAPLDDLQKMLNVSISTSLEGLASQPKAVQDIIVEAVVNVPSIKVPRITTPDVSIQASQLDVPEIRTMSVKAPVISVPDITLPELTVPRMRDITLSTPVVSLQVPNITLPDIEAPVLTVDAPVLTVDAPDLTLPELKVQPTDLSAWVPTIDLPSTQTQVSDLSTIITSTIEKTAFFKTKEIAQISEIKAEVMPLSHPDIEKPLAASFRAELGKFGALVSPALEAPVSKATFPELFLKIPDITVPDAQMRMESLQWPRFTMPEMIMPDLAFPKQPEIGTPQMPGITPRVLSDAMGTSSRMSMMAMDLRLKEQGPIEVHGNLQGNDIYLSNNRTSRNRAIID